MLELPREPRREAPARNQRGVALIAAVLVVALAVVLVAPCSIAAK